MSVINTMLRDLEQREGQTLSGRYQPPAPRRWRLLLGMALLLLIAVPALAYWLWSGKGDNDTDAAEPVAAGPVVQAIPLAEKLVPPVASTAVAPSAAAGTSSAVASSAVASASAVSSAVAPTVPQASASVNAPARAAVVATAALHSSETSSPQEPAVSEAVDDALLGPDEGPQPTEASELVDTESVAAEEPRGSLEIAEEHLSPQQEAALERRKGLQAISKGQLGVARDAFAQVLANDPLDHEIRERLAGLFYGEGRLPEAQQVLADGIRLAPAQANFRLMLARVALAGGNKAQALQTLSELEPMVSRNLDYYATRAALAQELEQPAVAARSYQQLVVVQPSEARWWLGLAIAMDKQGRSLAALDAYRKALTLPLSPASRQFVQQRIGQLE